MARDRFGNKIIESGGTLLRGDRRVELDASRGDLGGADDVQKIAHDADATVQATIAEISDKISYAKDEIDNFLGVDTPDVGINLGREFGNSTISTARGGTDLKGLFDKSSLSLSRLADNLNPDIRAADANMKINRNVNEIVLGTARSRAFHFDEVLDPFGDKHSPMKFPKELSNGSFLTKNPAEGPPVDDDEAYVPLSFMDVRPAGSDGRFRTVYFRPIITSLTEELMPEYDKRSFYGRSDQVVTYNGTMRTVFLGFELHAFKASDLDVIYKKLNWLASMVYPEYTPDMLLKAGPVCRIRVGDVICSKNKLGLPGVIDSLSFDYSDSIWDIDRDRKAPRSVKVAVSFHVLHDVVIGRGEDGNFGGLGYRDGEDRYTLSAKRPGNIEGNSRYVSKHNEENSVSNEVFDGSKSFRGFGDVSKGDPDSSGGETFVPHDPDKFSKELEQIRNANHFVPNDPEEFSNGLQQITGVGQEAPTVDKKKRRGSKKPSGRAIAKSKKQFSQMGTNVVNWFKGK